MEAIALGLQEETEAAPEPGHHARFPGCPGLAHPALQTISEIACISSLLELVIYYSFRPGEYGFYWLPSLSDHPSSNKNLLQGAGSTQGQLGILFRTWCPPHPQAGAPHPYVSQHLPTCHPKPLAGRNVSGSCWVCGSCLESAPGEFP
jgi:hypothetical protein